jgi:hypothetical protein
LGTNKLEAAWAQAQVDKRHGKRGVVTGIDQVAMEQHGGANAHRRPGHSGEQRLFEGSDATQEAKHGRLLRGGRLVQEVANVIARAEDALMPLKHHHAHGWIGRRLRQRFGHGRVHGRGDGVFLVQSVEGDGHHPRINVGQDVRHGGPCSVS